ncbi:hypothetical protein [Paenibacillus qinlingensis]|uniref:hypothetical protein n=1 Tax=Paenibacillus qinlingensis TaxID=1837343 RepID=UPI0015642C71|nr:hypothetical protein [Paenibacillus qinlingensis]NQX61925.1 hypothetical protein [Paenibacillus qinlingensis]
MQIKLRDDWFILSNSAESVEDVFSQVNGLIEDENLYIERVFVDGVEIHEDIRGYLLLRLSEIKKVEFIFISRRGHMMQRLIDTVNYLSSALPEVEALSSQIYNKMTDKTWSKISHLFEGIQFILKVYEAFTEMDNLNVYRQEYEVHLQVLIKEIRNIEIALSNSDYTLLADLIKYEIFPALTQLKDISLKIVEVEGVEK